MEVVRFVVGVTLPYVAVAVFIAGMLYRFYTWKTLPAPPITLFPTPRTEAANKLNVVQEAVFFRSLLRGDPLLWVLAWTFHVVLALIFLGHSRVFADADRLLLTLGMNQQEIQAMSSGVGGTAGVAILTAGALLLLRRLAAPRARQISGLSDYLVLLLIGAVVITGNLMRFGPEHFDLRLTRSYFAGLAHFAGVSGAAALKNNLFLAHMGLAFILIMILPFSKLLHFGGIFFTHQLIRKH